MNMGKKITDLNEGSAIQGESSYPVAMGDGTGVKQVKHKTLVEQLLADMEMPYDETLAMLTGTDEDGKQKIPNLQAISDWIRAKIVNSLLTTEEGFFLDARLGPVFDKRFKTVEDKVTQLNSDLAYHIYPPMNGGALGNQSDLNDIKTNFHKFVFNAKNIPTTYGFLDVSNFDGKGFSPALTGVIRQRFTEWDTGIEYTRCYQNGSWSPWTGVDSFLNFSGDTILNFYLNHRNAHGCFAVEVYPTDRPEGAGEGYISFMRDAIGHRVVVIYCSYDDSARTWHRCINVNRWITNWKER